jgi:hypothetical protein
MPEFWYEAPTNGEVAAREGVLPSHTTMLGLSVLVFALLIAALLIAR